MSRPLRAVIQGDKIHWLEASDEDFPSAQPVEALITPLHEQLSAGLAQQRAERRVAALKNLVSINAFSTIENPREWQRSARADRELPGRNPDAD